MGIKVCPVCGIDQNADDIAFQHHVNGHFDSDIDSLDDGFEKYIPGPSSPKKRRLSEMKSQEEEEILEDDSCPLCQFPFFAGVGAVERESHVNSCMDTSLAESTKDNSISFAITSTPSRTFSTSQSKDFLAIATKPATYSPIPSSSGTRSPTYVLSDQLIQQSLSHDMAGTEGMEDWDGPARPGGFVQWRTKNKVERGDGWWDPTKGKIGDLPDNFTPSLIPVLTDLLESSIHKGITKRAIIGRDTISIVGVFRFDSTWGCGYRNALMSISSLLLHSPTLSSLFSISSNGSKPCIRRLQGWLDEAWSKGHDPPGRAHFGGKILGGRKWIGTGDLYALFTYKGVPCDLYDFPKPKTADARPASKALTEWVRQYFDEGLSSNQSAKAGSSNAYDLLMRENEGTRGSAVRRADKYPLILQHNGHSRTVVGYEESSRGDFNLLMFDPGKQVPSYLRETAIRHTSSQRRSTSSSLPLVNRKESHEAIPFSAPYTNGASEMTQWCDTPRASSPLPTGAQRLDGGAIVGSDEEMNSTGWVRKKITKLTGDEGSGGESKKMKLNGEGGKGLAYFRVNLSTLGRHEEYQILAFTGDEPLSMAERGRRKELTSTIIT